MTAEAASWSPFENGPEELETPAPAPAEPAVNADPAPCTLHRHLRVVPDETAAQTGRQEPQTLHPAPDQGAASAGSGPAATAPETAPETAPAAVLGEALDADEAAVEEAHEGVSIADRLADFRVIWVPPNWRTERPASLDEVIAYADTAPWCAGEGKARKAGRVYNRVVAVPVSALAYVIAWIFQRPGRAITVGLAVGLWGLVLLVAF